METKFTPAPWCVQNAADPYTHIVRTGGTRFLCQLSQDTSGESRANAHLIAAAPELYEALVAAVECGMVPTSSAKDGGASARAVQVQVADQIRAALEKARGDES